MADPKQTDRPIAVTTPLGPDKLLLIGISGQEAVSRLFRYQLDVLAKVGTDVPFDKLLGQGITATIQFHPKEPKKRYLNGICCRVSEDGQDGEFTTYHLEIVPKFWLASRKAQSRIFQQMSVPDILKNVLDGYDATLELQGTFEKRDYCVQYRETDFNFACRLMEEEGIYFFFKHSDGSHKMVVANTPQSHSDVPDGNKQIYETVAGGNRPEDRIHDWRKVQELRSGKYLLWDHSFELPHKHLDAQKTIQESVQVGKVTHKLKVGGNDTLELYDYPGEYAQRFDGVNPGGSDQAAELQKIFQDNRRTVEIRMQEEAAASIVIQGASTCRQFVSGHKFVLDRHFNANGEYLLTSVSHSAVFDSYRSDSSGDFHYTNQFTCMPFALPFRPARSTPKPVVQGTQTAVVVGPPGEEIWPDKYGRVKVQFHWDREGTNDAKSSCWIRVSTMWAGKQWGMIHIPRIGQEVIVAFEEGDPDQPLIVGSVYNYEQMPPYKLPDNKTQSGVKSRSSKQGEAANFNEFRFEDKKGSEQVYVHAEKNFDAVIENIETREVGFGKKRSRSFAGDTLKRPGDQVIKIHNSQSVLVGAPTQDGTDPTDGNQYSWIFNNQGVIVGTGGGKAEDGSYIAEIWNNQALKIGIGEGQNSDGSQIVSIWKDRNVTLKTGNDLLSIEKGNREATIEMGNDALTIKMGNQTTKLSLGKSETEAMQSIELKVGSSSIKVDQLGVTIKGMNVKIEGQVQTEVKGLMTTVQSSAVTTVKGAITMIN